MSASRPEATPPLGFDDPRIPLAADRTLLAWVRTGLAMMGFGFVVARFGLFLREAAANQGAAAPQSQGASVWLGAGLVVLGVVVNLLAAAQHIRFLRGLRRGEVYQAPIWSLGVVVTLVMAAFGIAMVAYVMAEAGS